MLLNLRVFKLPVRLSRRIAKFGKNWQPIGRKWQDARRPLCDQRGRKETAMTQIDSTLDPFVEVEIKEHSAALIRRAYLMAANLAGGEEGLIGYLKKQAELENPSAFMTGLSKLLPSMLEGNPDAPLIVERVYYTRDGDA
jgi:hypothetical protein